MPKYKKIAFLFPGQGAQYPGMGKDFVENFEAARTTLEEADDLLSCKLSDVIINGPLDVLTETKNSQPGIYVICLAILRVLNKAFPELVPTVCSGLSLGEYTALTASRKLDFSEGVKLVQSRGLFMNEACEQTKGTMAVILGLNGEEVEALVKAVNMPKDLWVANFNCPGQVVLSGTQKGIEAGIQAAKTKGAKRTLPLQVHGAFHSGLMESAETKLARHIHQTKLDESTIEIVMNVPGNYVKDTNAMREFLIRQVTQPVRWEQGIRKMVEAGTDLFIEIGCGKTLTGFNKRIDPQIPTLNIETIKDLDILHKEIG
jgi:[acyl-carrier-protein] S-malonyltransferase